MALHLECKTTSMSLNYKSTESLCRKKIQEYRVTLQKKTRVPNYFAENTILVVYLSITNTLILYDESYRSCVVKDTADYPIRILLWAVFMTEPLWAMYTGPLSEPRKHHQKVYIACWSRYGGKKNGDCAYLPFTTSILLEGWNVRYPWHHSVHRHLIDLEPVWSLYPDTELTGCHRFHQLQCIKQRESEDERQD